MSLLGEGVHDLEGPKEPLGVLVKAHELFPEGLAEKAVQGVFFSLGLQDPLAVCSWLSFTVTSRKRFRVS